MNESDSLQRFLFTKANVRGEFIRLEQTYQTILNQHAYPPLVKQLLGDALMSAALLAGSMQFEGNLSLQFQGDERISLLLVQCDHELNLRALVKFKQSADDIDYNQAFLAGKMSLFIDQYNQTQAYQSIVPIHSVSMADNLSHYFAQSDQIKTKIKFATNAKQATGMLLQRMPETKPFEADEFWNYALTMAKTITEQELLSLDNQTILQRLYHETELELYPARDVAFGCHCNHEKMQQVLHVLGENEAQQLLNETNEVVINCDFCNQTYRFDANDIKTIFKLPTTPDIWVKTIDN